MLIQDSLGNPHNAGEAVLMNGTNGITHTYVFVSNGVNGINGMTTISVHGANGINGTTTTSVKNRRSKELKLQCIQRSSATHI